MEAQLRPLLGNRGIEGVAVIARASTHQVATTPFVLSGALILIAIFAIFVQVQEALDDLWDVPESKRGHPFATFTLRLHAIVPVCALGVLAFLSLLTAAMAGWLAGVLVNVLALILFLMVTYRYLPRETVSWKSCAIGAAVSGAILLFGEALISLYFAHFHPEAAYGSAGSFIIIVIWIYYSAQLFLFGAVLTRALEKAG